MNLDPKTVLKLKFLLPVILLLLVMASLFFVFRGRIPFFESVSSSDLIQEFSGSYYMGDGFLNCSFEIMPDSTFKIQWTSDMGYEVDFSGKVSVQDKKIVLEPAQTLAERVLCFHRTFIPVRWGDRKYLLPDDNDDISNYIVSVFCERVEDGREPRDDKFGFSYLRIADITIQVEGNPVRLDGRLLCP